VGIVNIPNNASPYAENVTRYTIARTILDFVMKSQKNGYRSIQGAVDKYPQRIDYATDYTRDQTNIANLVVRSSSAFMDANRTGFEYDVVPTIDFYKIAIGWSVSAIIIFGIVFIIYYKKDFK
jgi:hypothetical protein